MKTPSQARRLKIYIDEAERWQGRPLYQAVVEAAREEGLAGATVLKGLCGFGSKSHEDAGRHLRFGENPPIIIELVDSQENIARFLARLDELIRDGFVTLEDVQRVSYRAN
ncbi:MAG: DUF190 domain-containing protein [Elusimicrobia bacterium]|nr:DUF190 domain-containing protein [Elusimicrobiota bacterium]